MKAGSSELSRNWFLVIICAAGIAIGVAVLPFYTQGVFIEAWIKEFGWTRAQASLGVMASTLTLAAVTPFIGAIVDRFGLVKPIFASFAGLALSYIFLGLFLNSLTGFVLLVILQAILGAGSSPLAYTRAINVTFDKQRGLALGLALSGTGLTAMFGPAAVAVLIAQYGWRGAYFAISGFVFVVGLVVVLALSRLEKEETVSTVDPASALASFKSAAKTRTNWTLLIGMFCLSLAFGGTVVHFVPILLEIGLTMARATMIAGVLGIAVILGRIIVGFAVDRIFAPYVLITVIVACICGILALVTFGASAAIVAAFVLGFALGAEVDLISYMVAKYFSLAAYGRLYGRQYACFIVGMGVSPVLFGAIRDYAGAYTYSLYAALILLVVSVALFVTLPRFPSDHPN